MVRTVYQCEERITPSTKRHVLFINVKQEVLDATFDNLPSNTAPNLEVTVPVTAFSVSNRDRVGLHARGVFVAWQSSAPQGYKEGGRVWIPVLRPNLWSRIGLHNGGSYLGERFIIVGKRPETVRI